MIRYVKQIRHFFREYRQFGLVLLTVAIALPLDFFDKDQLAHILLAISAITNVIPLLWGMIQDLRTGTYGVDILAATAIITSIILGEYWAGVVIVLMLTGGESLEDYAETRAKTELTALLERAPKMAHIVRGRKILDVPINDVRVGDKIIVKPGEVVPVDATIVEGTAGFDESSLTGESLPVIKKVGDALLSGSVNVDGAITSRADRLAADSQYEQIVKLVRGAASSKAPLVRLADRYSIPFTIIAFGIGTTAWVISGQSIRFLEVLVVATPCPLILATPIALISGMSRAAKHGIIVKSGSAMERLANIRTIGFDKTGTLTVGQPTVSSIKTYGTFSRQSVLAVAAALERSSTHILARAIVQKAETEHIKIPKAKQVNEQAGSGLSAQIKGQSVLIGRLSLLEESAVSLPKNFKPSSIQQTATFIAIDGSLAGIISFRDEIRPDSKSTLAKLKQLGIKHMLMVTGDNKTAALAIARKLGINEVEAGALPVDKLKAVEQVARKPVAFVGDGVNDAPVLAAADVGIALGARGSTAASESADVVVMLDNIAQVAVGVGIAKRTFFIAKQSILIGIGLSVALMLVFSTGRFRPIYGAIVQELVDIVVIFNALRAHIDSKS